MDIVSNPGINPENIEAVVEKLKDAIGSKWVSKDPAVLTSYSRDFTISPGNWPNIVALPGSTEDVQKIIKYILTKSKFHQSELQEVPK